MSSKAFDKKKKREKEVKKKLLAKRNAALLKAKEERKKEKEQKELQRITNRLEGRTIRNNKMDDDKVINQLAHNMEILEALQKEQEALKQNQPIEGGKLTASADVVFIPNKEENVTQ